MRYVVMAVRDVKADSFARPMFVQSEGTGLRSFGDEVNREARDNLLHTHPEDFELYVLGTYEEETGAFALESRPRQVAVGSQFKVQK